MSSALRTAVAPALRALPFHPPTPSTSSSLSTLALRALQSGSLVPDALILSLTSHRLSQPDCRSNGWVLDGLPRTPAQAASLLATEQTRPDAVLHLRVPADVIRDRLVHRRRDPVTGATYNLKTAPPASSQVRDRLEPRPDDAPHVVDKRLQTYDRVMPSVWHVFQAHDVPVVQVDVAAEDNVHDVQQRVMDQVDGWQKVVVAGPPGCGKGTHGLKLADELHGVHVSTGDLLRQVAEKAREEEEERVVGLIALAAQMRQQGRRAAA